MKKIYIVLYMMLVTLVFITGCTNKNVQSFSNKKDKIIVYTSFYPMYDFAKNIGKDKIDLKTIVPQGIDAHDFEPTARLIGNMQSADVFIYNGLGIEPWADKFIKSMDSNKLITVNTSSGIDVLKNKDNHIWLNPLNAIKQCENIKNALIKADKKNKGFYENNYNEYIKKLKKLDNDFSVQLSNIKQNKIVTSHDAFGYLADRYNLKQIAISGLVPQEEPSSSKMAEIAEIVKKENINYIFSETLSSPKLSNVLAKETNTKTAMLNPIEGLSKEDIDKGKNYISIMEENLKILKKTLGE